MSKLTKYICPEGVEALRTFAAAMPVAVENINNSADRLRNVYNSVENELGGHGASIGEMLEYIIRAKGIAAGAIEELPKGLEATASKIEAVLAKKPNIAGK